MTNIRTNIRLLLAGLLTLLLFTLSSFGRDQQSEPETPEKQAVTVEITNLQFVPNEIAVPAGTTINWVNHDPVDHCVTSAVSTVRRKTRALKQTKLPTGNFSAGLSVQDNNFSIILDETGEHADLCNIHPVFVPHMSVY